MNDAKFDSYLHALRMSYPDQAELVVAVAREGYACGAEQIREEARKLASGEAQGEAPQHGPAYDHNTGRDWQNKINAIGVEAGAHPSQDAHELEMEILHMGGQWFPSFSVAGTRFLSQGRDDAEFARKEGAEIYEAIQRLCRKCVNLARSTPSLPAQDATIQKLWQLRDDVEMFIQHDGEIGSIDYNASKTFQSRHHMMQTAVQLRGKSGGSTPSPDPQEEK